MLLGNFRRYLNRKISLLDERDSLIISELSNLRPGSTLLDAGCGPAPFLRHYEHTKYELQDFGSFSGEQGEGLAAKREFQVAELDIISDIAKIPRPDSTYDVVLCTEVLEHVADAPGVLKELSRLLKPGGKLIVSAPSNCLRHFDPFFFSSGYSDNFYREVLGAIGFLSLSVAPVGHYHSWLAQELARTMAQRPMLLPILGPAFAYFFLKRRTQESVRTMCHGYVVVAVKA